METNLKHKVWGSTARQPLHPLIGNFLSKSDIGFEKGADYFLIEEEIFSTIAHVKMLMNQQILTKEIASDMIQVLEKLDADKIDLTGYEDIHSAIEDIVIQKTGYTPHIGRSRNDQISTILRLHYKKQLNHLKSELKTLIQDISVVALKNTETVIPLYTHHKQAEISTIGHLFHSYMESLVIDIESLDNCLSEIDRNPLGSAALAGTSHNINREQTSWLMNFSKLHGNTLSAISDRGLIDFKVMSLITQIIGHCGRISQDLIFYSLDEIEIVKLGESVTTGSSIMPQKKNPDPMEIIIGKADLYASYLPFMASLINKSSGYHRELQESKKILITVLQESQIMLQVLQIIFQNITIKVNNIIKDQIYAVEVANYLMKRENLSFREAHEIVTTVILESENFKEELVQKNLLTGDEITNLFDPLKIINAKNHSGSPRPSGVKKEIEEIISKI